MITKEFFIKQHNDYMSTNKLERMSNNGVMLHDLELIWNALTFYREHGIPEGNESYDKEWDDICITMEWIRKDCNI